MNSIIEYIVKLSGLFKGSKGWLTTVLLLIIIFIGFLSGFKIREGMDESPIYITDTLLVYDTVHYYIPDSIPYYIVKRDTVIYHDTVFKDVDTAFILKDYHAYHVYNRSWIDTNIIVNITDTITRNMPMGNYFDYYLLQPTTTIINQIDNTITYNRYISLGLDIPLPKVSYSRIEALYHNEKWYAGAGYTPKI
jgi:hypothetical protein